MKNVAGGPKMRYERFTVLFKSNAMGKSRFASFSPGGQVVDQRHFVAARVAPASEKIKHKRLAAKSFQRDRFSVEGLQIECYGRSADRGPGFGGCLLNQLGFGRLRSRDSYPSAEKRQR
jgi:hypothetical protein